MPHANTGSAHPRRPCQGTGCRGKENPSTKSEVARRRLIAAGSKSHDTVSGFELIADLIGTVEGGPADMSSRKKEYLKTKDYADVPMSIADACMVRLTEILPAPLLLTTDSDFKI